jgi:hypothetical protein
VPWPELEPNTSHIQVRGATAWANWPGDSLHDTEGKCTKLFINYKYINLPKYNGNSILLIVNLRTFFSWVSGLEGVYREQMQTSMHSRAQMLRLIAQFQAPNSLPPIEYMFIWLFVRLLYDAVFYSWSRHLSTSHISRCRRGWFWMIYLRGCRMVVAYLRHSNRVTEEQQWTPQSGYPGVEVGTSRVLSKLCEYSAAIRHQSGAVTRHILCPQRGSNPSSSDSDLESVSAWWIKNRQRWLVWISVRTSVILTWFSLVASGRSMNYALKWVTTAATCI